MGHGSKWEIRISFPVCDWKTERQKSEVCKERAGKILISHEETLRI